MSLRTTKPTKWHASGDSDQHWHSPSLISVFTARSVGSSGPKISSCGQRRLRPRGCTVRCAHMAFCWLCHAQAQMFTIALGLFFYETAQSWLQKIFHALWSIWVRPFSLQFNHLLSCGPHFLVQRRNASTVWRTTFLTGTRFIYTPHWQGLLPVWVKEHISRNKFWKDNGSGRSLVHVLSEKKLSLL